MANSVQHRSWISGRGAARAALTSVVVLLLGMIATQAAQAQTFSVLHHFTKSDGANPYAGLIQDAKGNLYGTTLSGGNPGGGTVFMLDAKGTETVLHGFGAGRDGANPYAGLVRDAAGNLYGTTFFGGTGNGNSCMGGCGTLFKVTKAGKEIVLHNFCSRDACADGGGPIAGLLRDKKGNLYGATNVGGEFDLGTVFKLDKSGKETVLHSFAGGMTDGANPYYAGLLMDKAGNLYGATLLGGDLRCNLGVGCGVVFKVDTSGTETVLHRFAGGTTDGCYPYGTLVRDATGNFYGTTNACGSSNLGTVWKLSRSGTETVLHSFAGGATDGAGPIAGVILDPKGNLYSVTPGGGAANDGIVYKLSETGTLTVLHSFSSSSDGAPPIEVLVRDSKGNLYGTAYAGGNGNPPKGNPGYGTVWQLSPSLRW